MSSFSVRGFSAAAGGTSDVIGQLWNPDANAVIRIHEVLLSLAGTIVSGTNTWYLRTSSARGTPGSTVTPDADNSWEADDVPSSGALLDLASFSADPTMIESLWSASSGCTASTGTAGTSALWRSSRGILIPPGRGLVVVGDLVGSTRPPTTELSFGWEEE